MADKVSVMDLKKLWNMKVKEKHGSLVLTVADNLLVSNSIIIAATKPYSISASEP